MTPFEEIEKRRQEEWERSNNAFHKRMEQDEIKRHNREVEISERIKASGLSRDGYVVQQLIDAVRKNKVDVKQIHICDLGFPGDLSMWREINALFDTLKKDGCIKSYCRVGNEYLDVFGLSRKNLIKKMKQYHPSLLDPSSTRRTIFEGITVFTALGGLVVSIIFGYLNYTKSNEIEFLQNEINDIYHRLDVNLDNGLLLKSNDVKESETDQNVEQSPSLEILQTELLKSQPVF